MRIPKPLLDQCGFKDEVELEVQNDTLVIRSRKQTRKNWESAFKKMAQNKDDQLIETIPTEWEEGDWEW